MAIEWEVNSGFVTVAPSVDPDASSASIDGSSDAMGPWTAPVGATKITEIGWWCDNATEETNFEVAIYDHDSGNNRPGEIVGVSRTNAKGTGAGWKTSTVDINISASTIYWVAVQVDDTSTTTNLNFATDFAAGIRQSRGSTFTELPDPWNLTAFENGQGFAIYAVYEIAAAGTNTQINIGNVWKESPAWQINIGNAWKAIEGIQINIGNVWKEVF